jgi:hypothetical protein
VGHLLDVDDERDPGAPGLDALDRLMHRRGARRAGVLDAGRRLEPEPIVGLQHDRSREVLRAEAGVEMAEQDLVDVLGRDPGVGQRLIGDPDDKALHGLCIELAERRVGPTDDAGGHGGVLSRCRPLNVAVRRGPGKAAIMCRP